MTIGKVALAGLARDAVGGLTITQALAIAELQHKAITKAESHDLRRARYMRKQIGRQLGKAGEMIHHLRGEVAQLRLEKQSMVNNAIEELIRGAVLQAVPVEINSEGSLVLTSDVPADLSAATEPQPIDAGSGDGWGGVPLAAADVTAQQ